MTTVDQSSGNAKQANVLSAEVREAARAGEVCSLAPRSTGSATSCEDMNQRAVALRDRVKYFKI
jgi:hypothetical protein